MVGSAQNRSKWRRTQAQQQGKCTVCMITRMQRFSYKQCTHLCTSPASTLRQPQFRHRRQLPLRTVQNHADGPAYVTHWLSARGSRTLSACTSAASALRRLQATTTATIAVASEAHSAAAADRMLSACVRSRVVDRQEQGCYRRMHVWHELFVSKYGWTLTQSTLLHRHLGALVVLGQEAFPT